MVSSVGANSYGGQLMSQEVMQLKYKVPFYIKNGLVAQANYVNSLESAGLINNVPESMDNIDVILPSYKLVEKAEAEQRGSSYVGYDSKSHKRIEAMIQTVNNVTGKDALMTHTLPIADLKKLQTIIKEHYPNKSASGIITRYLGNRKLPNLYDKLNKCYRALGAANKECSHEM
jgi:hypothetical protein